MTLPEFKAWFEGYTENISKQPTQKQWARIQERVSEIDSKPVTEKVFIDRYWKDYQPTWYGPYVTYTSGKKSDNTTITCSNQTSGFSSTSAFYALGKAEAN